MAGYEERQIKRVIDANTTVYRLKITGSAAETKWLNVSEARVREILALFEADPEPCLCGAPKDSVIHTSGYISGLPGHSYQPPVSATQYDTEHRRFRNW